MKHKISSVGSGSIDDGTQSNVVTYWVMFVLLGGAALGVLWMVRDNLTFDMESPDFNPIFLLAVFLGVFALVYLARALRWTLQQRRYGTSALDVRSGDGVGLLGEPLEGVVRTPKDLYPREGFKLVLRCYESHDFREPGEPEIRNVRSAVVWEETLVVPADGLASSRGIPFSFQLPATVGTPSRVERKAHDPNGIQFKFKAAIWIPGRGRKIINHNASPGHKQWELQVKAVSPEGKFETVFAVPVRMG
ncbi:hypothetical protein FEM03_22915 [Phragmitibacter flavus]|uniref:Uncharacterized protein n=1 Tax=Phragmitibacter flavus TaxID=2576071 RepID=A0A5R8K7N0_9BACT|nr:hypothetical protein [Phragmitibacter flavus]TLD68358.1 hypothetical protein FEM03_22915 [Phragmitibacter flavus]